MDILFNKPYTKFLLLEDTLQHSGKRLLNALIKHHKAINSYQIHVFCYENDPSVFKKMCDGSSYRVYDFSNDPRDWDNRRPSFSFKEITKSAVVIIDSLALKIHEDGVQSTCQFINSLKSNNNVVQIIALLHCDMVYEESKTTNVFEYLATTTTTTITLKQSKNTKNKVISYIHKKPGGKVVSKTEEYWFENDIFKSKEIEQVKKQNNTNEDNSVLPESLTTFKISLGENDKKLRDELILPYLRQEPKSGLPLLSVGNSTGTGKVFYQPDENDDWEEEDPDDDLDI